MPNDAYFQGNPIRLDTSRCSFNRKPRWSGSWLTGRLVPIYANSLIMPGDTLSMSIASAIRLATPKAPTMDDMDITIEAFFVPHRLVMSRKSMSPSVNDSNNSWAAFIGAQDSLLNMPVPGDVKLPDCSIITGPGYVKGGVADCLGMPERNVISGITSNSYYVNALRPLAYYSVWNEYFRDPNSMSPVTYFISSDHVYFVGQDAGIPSSGTYQISMFPLAPVSRYHGVFGSALPWPQRNLNAVQLPLGNSAPVITGSDLASTVIAGRPPLHWADDQSGTTFNGNAKIGLETGTTGYSTDATWTNGGDLIPNNLYADLSTATAATVNQFRIAVQTQKWAEHLARCGNKLDDLNAGMYGVTGVQIQDRPEYLGGFTAPINVSQVAVTSASDVGETGAFSLSNPGGFLFKKSFTEHGTVIVVACCRVKDSFCQGVPVMDKKFDRFDYYWPEFANLGEVPLYQETLFVNGNSGEDKKVFGYQEAWFEYRMEPDLVTGYMRPTVTGGLGFMTYCNNFSTPPDLKGYLDASKEESNVDQTIQVSGSTAGYQFYGQFQFDCNWIRPMPLYSIPGLVDHH